MPSLLFPAGMLSSSSTLPGTPGTRIASRMAAKLGTDDASLMWSAAASFPRGCPGAWVAAWVALATGASTPTCSPRGAPLEPLYLLPWLHHHLQRQLLSGTRIATGAIDRAGAAVAEVAAETATGTASGTATGGVTAVVSADGTATALVTESAVAAVGAAVVRDTIARVIVIAAARAVIARVSGGMER